MKLEKQTVTESISSESSRDEARITGDDNQATSACPNVFAQKHSAEEGGMPTDIYCPACGEEISGSYLPMFRCPHCDVLIFRDDKGNVTNYEQKHTCPECGHIFGEMSDEASTEFRRMVRNFEQKTESAILGLDKIVSRIFA